MAKVNLNLLKKCRTMWQERMSIFSDQTDAIMLTHTYCCKGYAYEQSVGKLKKPNATKSISTKSRRDISESGNEEKPSQLHREGSKLYVGRLITFYRNAWGRSWERISQQFQEDKIQSRLRYDKSKTGY